MRFNVKTGTLFGRTDDNMADFFTKPLAEAVKTFRAMRDRIMNKQQPDPDDKSRTHSRKGRDERIVMFRFPFSILE